MPQDLGDAHVRDIFGADGLLLAGGGHLRASEAGERGVGELHAKGGDEGSALGVA
jgi:hypothetical protein